MADISLIREECIDDCDEGVYEQGDCNFGGTNSDDVLPPFLRVQKYAQSVNVYDRQMVSRIVQELFRTSSSETLTEDIPNIMKIVINIGEEDESMVRADLLEQIPQMATQAIEYSTRIPILQSIVSEYLLPLVVRNLGCSDNAVDKAAHTALIQLTEQRLITQQQAEIQVCPAILALSKEEPTADLHTSGAIPLMSRMAPLLGRDVTERIFLNTFAELCTSHMFFIRKTCASHLGDFCAVVGRSQYENVLLPCFIELCRDDIWGVRKSCAEVVMFVSSACPSALRRSTLAPAFINLLQDSCRWVQMSAFQTLGPFISTFADPTVTNMAHNGTGDLVFVNNDGNEFAINSPSVMDIRFCKFKIRKATLLDLVSNLAVEHGDFLDDNYDVGCPDENNSGSKFAHDDDDGGVNDANDDDNHRDGKLEVVAEQTKCDDDDAIKNNLDDDKSNNLGIVATSVGCSSSSSNNNINNIENDKDIKEIVETVKNAVLSYRNVDQQQQQYHGIEVGGKKDSLTTNNLSNDVNVISDNIQSDTCDNLGSTINEISDYLNNLTIKNTGQLLLQSETNSLNLTNNNGQEQLQQSVNNNNNNVINNNNNENNIESTAVAAASNQVNLTATTITSSGSENEDDDNLRLFNSYNYWYISPDIPIDLNLIEDSSSKSTTTSDDVFGVVPNRLVEDAYVTINLNDSSANNSGNIFSDTFSSNNNNNNTSLNTNKLFEKLPEQDIVPQILINHFISMTDSSVAINIDNEMSYHCAYSLPAVALTLGSENWFLLKSTVERLASDMQYKVRRTVASSLHELALILGPEIATNHLTPLFEGFIKDLDEVRIGILKHLAHFLRLIDAEKRRAYLSSLSDFLNTENESNWRFRQELARQLLLVLTLFKPKDVAKNIALIAQVLLDDKVSAVRKVAILLITELVRYISTKPGLTSHLLVKLTERFAHSKHWKRRQTFALLCCELLSSQALPPEQFATEIMPHFLDLSWDPVANVRLVVARTISRHIITNEFFTEYFADVNNQHYDVPEVVLRRLKADKDCDVCLFACD